MRAIYVFLFVASVLGSPNLIHKQQILSLPNSLIFATAKYSPTSNGRSFLSRIDVATQQAVFFYGNSDWDVLPLTWSSRGTYLAVVFSRDSPQPEMRESQVCVLTRLGKLQACMLEKPSIDLVFWGDSIQYTATWSADEKKLYFMSGTFQAHRLIEADVLTGQTIRVVYYENDHYANFTNFSWSSNLSHLIIGADDPAHVAHESTSLLIQLSPTNNQQPISTTDLAQVTPSIDGATASSLSAHHFLVPCPFSPHDTYIAAYDDSFSADKSLEFIIMDQQGTIKYSLDSNNAILPKTCPAWQNDEKALYFPYWDPVNNPSVSSSHPTASSIYRYVLASGQITSYYNGSLPLSIDSPLSVSPDGNYLAFDTGYNPTYVPTGTMPFYADRIAVVGPGNTVNYYADPYTNGSRPVWMPR